MRRLYKENILGEVLLEILKYHHDIDTCYELDEEAEEVYEQIIDKYNGQFNLKYSGKIFFIIFCTKYYKQ